MPGDHNPDVIHVENSLLRFIDRPLPLSDALALGAEAIGADIEIVAEALDCLVSTGELQCRESVVFPKLQSAAWLAAAKYSGRDYFVYADDEESGPFSRDSAIEFLHIKSGIPFSDADSLLRSAFEDIGFWIKAEGDNSFNRKTEYEEDRYDKPPEQLDAKAADESILALYREWLAIVERHPEWRAKLEPGNGPASLNISDPNAAMQGVEDRFEYDKSSVRSEDQAEFERFLALDNQIKEFERQNPPHTAALHSLAIKRAASMARMSGLVRQADLGIGLFLKSGKLVFSAGETNPMKVTDGDVILFYASDIALQQHGCDLNQLPFDEQLEILEEAEDALLKERQKQVQADMGMTDGEQPPAPDPVKAPNGWESIQDASGKKTWRSKSDPNVTLERPQ